MEGFWVKWKEFFRPPPLRPPPPPWEVHLFVRLSLVFVGLTLLWITYKTLRIFLSKSIVTVVLFCCSVVCHVCVLLVNDDEFWIKWDAAFNPPPPPPPPTWELDFFAILLFGFGFWIVYKILSWLLSSDNKNEMAYYPTPVYHRMTPPESYLNPRPQYIYYRPPSVPRDDYFIRLLAQEKLKARRLTVHSTPTPPKSYLKSLPSDTTDCLKDTRSTVCTPPTPPKSYSNPLPCQTNNSPPMQSSDSSYGRLAAKLDNRTAPLAIEYDKKPLTPHQGTNRVFGCFHFFECKREWRSSRTWANMGQECKKCRINIYPYKQTPLKKRSARTKGKRSHAQNLCEMCKTLGQSCLIKDLS